MAATQQLSLMNSFNISIQDGMGDTPEFISQQTAAQYRREWLRQLPAFNKSLNPISPLTPYQERLIKQEYIMCVYVFCVIVVTVTLYLSAFVSL